MVLSSREGMAIFSVYTALKNPPKLLGDLLLCREVFSKIPVLNDADPIGGAYNWGKKHLF